MSDHTSVTMTTVSMGFGIHMCEMPELRVQESSWD